MSDHSDLWQQILALSADERLQLANKILLEYANQHQPQDEHVERKKRDDDDDDDELDDMSKIILAVLWMITLLLSVLTACIACLQARRSSRAAEQRATSGQDDRNRYVNMPQPRVLSYGTMCASKKLERRQQRRLTRRLREGQMTDLERGMSSDENTPLAVTAERLLMEREKKALRRQEREKKRQVRWTLAQASSSTSPSSPILSSSASSSSTSSDEEELTCPICLDAFEYVDYITLLGCQHSYHVRCLERWLQQRNLSCPMCRAPVPITSGHVLSMLVEAVRLDAIAHGASSQEVVRRVMMALDDNNSASELTSPPLTTQRDILATTLNAMLATNPTTNDANTLSRTWPHGPNALPPSTTNIQSLLQPAAPPQQGPSPAPSHQQTASPAIHRDTRTSNLRAPPNHASSYAENDERRPLLPN
jgi:hypothetical protein